MFEIPVVSWFSGREVEGETSDVIGGANIYKGVAPLAGTARVVSGCSDCLSRVDVVWASVEALVTMVGSIEKDPVGAIVENVVIAG